MIPIETIGWIATGLAVAGTVLNNYRSSWCFGIWCVANMLTFVCHWQLGVWSLMARDAIFLVLAIHGLFLWNGRPA